MTTITYKDGVMAADTQATMGDEKAYGAVKLFYTEKFLIGLSGNFSNVLPFQSWLKDTEQAVSSAGVLHQFWDSIPAFGDGFTAILVDTGGRIWNCGSTFPPVTLHRIYDAIGSGSDFAMAAMECGKSATDAVRIASKFDIYTGGSVISMKARREE